MGSRAIPSVSPCERQSIRAKLLIDAAHYDDLVLKSVGTAKVSVWISTANLKTMLIEAPIGSRARARGRFISFYESLGDLARRGVEVRILHAGRPSGPLAKEIERLGSTKRNKSSGANSSSNNNNSNNSSGNISMRQCPRVHLKMIVVDGRLLYLGSANLTGAGLGAKGDGRRNFEMGIVTDNEAMLDAAQERFDRIWRGAECASCKLRSECAAPLDQPLPPLPRERESMIQLKTKKAPSSPRKSIAKAVDRKSLIAIAKQITPPPLRSR